MPPTAPQTKIFLRELSLIRLYTVLVMSFLYFVLQLVLAHVAHSLILQVDAYHMLYNILGLVTSIITTKMCREEALDENKLKNTFGWARIDVIGAVAGICFLAASCFSVVIECMQAMFHAAHHEQMTMPLYVLVVGCLGLAVNSFALLIIGGYTQQQRGFLESHREGSELTISPAARRGPGLPRLKLGGPLDTLRDFFGSLLVIVVSLVVHFYQGMGVTIVDPLTSIIAVFILGALSYKYAREAGYILLLTIPEDIDVQSMLDELYEKFPEICDVHEFHVWQLNPSRVIATAHVVLKNMSNCWIIQNNIISFLESKGITQVTLQPEFVELMKDNSKTAASPTTLKRRQCFLPCQETEDCDGKQCCIPEDLLSELSNHGHGGHGHSHSHTNSSNKGLFSWKNPLRSKSLNNVNSKEKDIQTKPGRTSMGTSNPELAIHEISESGIEAAPAGSIKLVPPSLQSAVNKASVPDDVSSGDDEEEEVRKPML